MGSDGLTILVGPASPNLVGYMLHQAAVNAAPPHVDEVGLDAMELDEFGQDVLDVAVQLGGALPAAPPPDRSHWVLLLMFWFFCAVSFLCLQIDE